MKAKRFLAAVLALVLLCSVLSFAGAAYEFQGPRNQKSIRLSFPESGKLRILQLADIQDGPQMLLIEQTLLRAAVAATKPDLIVMTGDNIAGYKAETKKKAETAIRKVMDVLDPLGIPIAMVYGNHDDDRTAFTKVEQMDLYESYSNFIGYRGVIATKTIDTTSINVGTYNLPVYESADSDKVIFNIWCIDSGNYNPDRSVGGYGYVFPEQLEWYVDQSNALKEANGGKPVPSIAFQHIIPPQIFSALKEVPAGTEGAVGRDGIPQVNEDGTTDPVEKYYVLPDDADPAENRLCETPCPPEPSFAPGYAEVDTMLEQGDVFAVFCGHDHVNHYVVNYKGIDLVSSQGCTFESYNNNYRGFRVITIDRDNPATFESEYVNGFDLLRPYPFSYAFAKIYQFFNGLIDKIKAAF